MDNIYDNDERWIFNSDSDVKVVGVKRTEVVNRLGDNIVNRLPSSSLISTFIEILQSEADKINCGIDIKNYYETEVLNMSVEEKANVGNTILDIILDQSDMLKSQASIDRETKHKNIYISIEPSYIDNLIKICASPQVLPMVSRPYDWEIKTNIIENKNENGNGNINENGIVNDSDNGDNEIENKNVRNQNQKYVKNISYTKGGYYTIELKRAISKLDFIKQNFKNRIDSLADTYQVNCINYLNKQKYRVNKKMLSLLLHE